tara:strand:+ start:314 stop:568 length:255 start_codon:yes stop_codon:yes gene_type:complete
MISGRNSKAVVARKEAIKEKIGINGDSKFSIGRQIVFSAISGQKYRIEIEYVYFDIGWQHGVINDLFDAAFAISFNESERPQGK